MDDYDFYGTIEQTIDYAFKGKFMLDMYEYLRSNKSTKTEALEFLDSKTAQEIYSIVTDLEDYLEGGSDEIHKQLREGYGHLGKPEARKIKDYLQGILDDAKKYGTEKRRIRRKSSK